MSEPRNVPEIPSFVWARKPQSPVPDWLYLAAQPATISKIIRAGLRAKMGEYWGLVHGNFPANPQPYDTPARTPGLGRPTAIFRGVRRPLHDGIVSNDKDVLIYVTNPERNFTLRERQEGNTIVEAARPTNSVFTTFVTLRPEQVDAARTSMAKAASDPINGLVLYWEWTEASDKDPRLPLDFDTRYDGQLL